MRQKGTARTSQNATTATADHQQHWHGLYGMTPIALLVMIVICSIALWVFTNLQITGTENSVYGLLQLSTTYPPNATAAQVAQFLNGQLSRNQTIADAIGWGVQIVLWTVTLSPDAALVLIHLKHNDTPQHHLARNAALLGKLRLILMWLLIGADILTDFVYVVQGHTLFVMDGWYPSIAGAAAAGTILAGLMYPAVIIFINVFVAKYLFAFIEALFSKLRAAATVTA